MNQLIRYYDKDIDLSDFSLAINPKTNRSKLALSVSESGFLSLNEPVLITLKTRALEVRVNSDYTIVLLNEKGTPNFSFPKSGRLRNQAFVKEMKAHGIQIPARYEFYYSKQYDLWIGTLADNVIKTNSLQKSVKKITSGAASKKAQ
ncbi:MAG: hypothetical protein A2Y17_02200 [Clostridiales bacterium GWF2_38_85]|nr:MAG: hypothetical protein A2Y17_02200 [Clostridiales bacterium GWF2_38_85]HBL85106.1 hypothetical protein [Clostridiales bacterium]